MELVVALLQLLPTGTLEGNLEKGLSACRKARSMGPMWLSSLRCGAPDISFLPREMDRPSPKTTPFSRLSRA